MSNLAHVLHRTPRQRGALMAETASGLLVLLVAAALRLLQLGTTIAELFTKISARLAGM